MGIGRAHIGAGASRKAPITARTPPNTTRAKKESKAHKRALTSHTSIRWPAPNPVLLGETLGTPQQREAGAAGRREWSKEGMLLRGKTAGIEVEGRQASSLSHTRTTSECGAEI